MHFKKLLALLVSAALMLSLLAGCGNGKALSQVIVDLLDNLYSNVSVEADSDLTAALKQAAAEGGTEEEILSRMIEILNHNGVSITFTRLGSGQQGDHAVTLYFQTGTDPDAAARNALAQWASVLGTLPDDGSYQGDVAMIEAENGYYIALDVEVLKAGTPDKPDKDDDEPETQEPKDPYTDNKDGSYTINTKDGLQQLVEDLNWPADHTILSADITLDSDVDLQGFNWTPIGTSSQSPYTGTFDGRGHKISGLNAITPPANTAACSAISRTPPSGIWPWMRLPFLAVVTMAMLAAWQLTCRIPSLKIVRFPTAASAAPTMKAPLAALWVMYIFTIRRLTKMSSKTARFPALRSAPNMPAVWQAIRLAKRAGLKTVRYPAVK